MCSFLILLKVEAPELFTLWLFVFFYTLFFFPSTTKNNTTAFWNPVVHPYFVAHHFHFSLLIQLTFVQTKPVGWITLSSVSSSKELSRWTHRSALVEGQSQDGDEKHSRKTPQPLKNDAWFTAAGGDGFTSYFQEGDLMWKSKNLITESEIWFKTNQQTSSYKDVHPSALPCVSDSCFPWACSSISPN